MKARPGILDPIAFLFVMLVLVGGLVPFRSNATETQSPVDSLEVVIDSLRCEARYEEAVGTARKLLEVRRGDRTAKPYEIPDAEMLMATLQMAADLPDTVRKELAEADRLDQEIEEAYAAGNYKVGAEKARLQLGLRRRSLGNEHPEVAESLNNLSVLLGVRGDYARAEPLAREALAMRRMLLGNEHPEVANSLNNLAMILQDRGDYAGAEPLARETLAMYRKLLGNERPDVALCLNNLAALLQYRGDYAGAEPLFREALAMRRKLFGNEHPDVTTSLNNLAALLQYRGDYAGAEPLSREALTMRRKLLGHEHPDVATDLNNLARILQDRGDYAGAEPLFRESLAMSRKLLGNEHPKVALRLNGLARFLQDRGDYSGAEPLFREALTISRKPLGNEHPEVARSLHNFASFLQARGNHEGAEPLFREALAMRRKLLGDEHPDVARSLQSLAVLRRTRGVHAEAESLLVSAATTYERARLRAGIGLERLTFQQSPYPSLAAVRLEIGKSAEAWPPAERALGRTLADLLLASEARLLSPKDAHHSDSLRISLGDAEKWLGALRKEARRDSTSEARQRVEEARNRLLQVEATWSTFQREMAEKHPVAEGQAFPLPRLQKQLSDKSAILGWLDVEWQKGESESWGYVIRDRGPVHWAKLDAAAIVAHGQSFRKSLTDPLNAAADPAAQALFRERIAPLKAHLAGVEQIVVLPSGGMLGVPVEALEDERGVLLGERYAISYCPSATIHTWLREMKRPARDARPGLFVGDPVFAREEQIAASNASAALTMKTKLVMALASFSSVFRGGEVGNDAALDSLPPLPETRFEVQECSKLFRGSKVLLGREATEQALVTMAQRNELRSYRVLHFATHALTNDDRPELSPLVLSRRDLPDELKAALAGERVYDGLVDAKEIVREWELDADLVVLSGCETGLGREVAGEGYIGLASAFLQSGARSVLVSLWPVDDHSTSLLMRRFYENWAGASERGSMSKVEALQEAKSWLRRYSVDADGARYAAPLYWAGFILIGDPS